MSYVGSMTRDTIDDRVLTRIAQEKGDVFLRADFRDLGGYDQVGRALLGLVRKGGLIKVGYGLYGRARPSTLDGRPVLVGGLRTLKDALRRVGVEIVLTRMQQAYNDRRSTQVPTGQVVGVRGRVRRQVGYDGFTLGYERAGPTAR